MTLKKYFRILYLIIFSGILVLNACGKRKSNNSHILQKEKLLLCYPDSALKLMPEIEKNRKLSPVDNAALQLLKAYALFLSDDSCVRVKPAYDALEYYKGSGLAREEGLAYFLYGHALLENNEIDQGVIELKKSLNILANTHEYNLIGLANYYIGYNYSLDAMYEKALHRLKLAAIYFEHANEKVNMAYAYREIANAFDLGRYPVDSALVYFDKAGSLLLAESDTSGFQDVKFYKAITLLNRTHRFSEAKQNILEVYRYFDNDSYYHNKLSYAYARCGMADSSMYYYKISLQDTTNIFSKMAVNMAGAYAFMESGDYKKAVKSFIEYEINKTKVFDQAQKSRIYRIDKGFDLSEKEKENATLRTNQRNMLLQFAVLTILVLVLVFAFLINNQRRKNEQIQYLVERRRLLENMEQKRIVLLAKIQARIDNILRINKMEAKLRHGILDGKSFVDEMLLNSVLPEPEWSTYISEIDMICNHHITALANKYPALTVADKIVIALTSLKIDITDSCAILGMNKNTMYRRRNTIKERLGLDKNIDFETWILEQITVCLAKEQQNTLIDHFSGHQ